MLSGHLGRWRAPAADGARAALEARARRLAAVAGAAVGLEVTLDALHPAPAGVALAGAGFAVSPGPGLPACTVRLCPVTAAALVSAVAGTEAPPLSTSPDRITRAVLGHAVLVALAAIAGDGALRADPAGTGGTRVPLAPALAASPPGPPVLCFEARLDLGPRAGRVQVAFDAAGAARLDPHRVPPGRPLPPWLQALPLRLELCAGPVRLTRATLDCLEAGDAICPDPDLAYDGVHLTGPACLAAGRGAAALGHLEGGHLEVAALKPPSPRHREVPMSAPPPIDALQVDLRVVLATVPATLGELAALEPGSVVPLPGPDPEVHLAVGDTVVARGALVEVDGVLGVQVHATCGETGA